MRTPSHRALGTAAPDDDAEPRITKWLPTIIIAIGLLAVAASIVFTRITNDRQYNTETQLSNTAQQASNLADQIKAECTAGRLTGPVCDKATQVAAEPVPGEPGLPGVPGTPGQPGRPGAPGTTGPSGAPGQPGASPPCLDEPAQCRGTDGRNGTDGQNGTDGANGQDGKNGSDGRDGRDGTPAIRMTKYYPDGAIETCDRKPESPDTAPEYDCQVTTPPPGEPPPP